MIIRDSGTTHAVTHRTLRTLGAAFCLLMLLIVGAGCGGSLSTNPTALAVTPTLTGVLIGNQVQLTAYPAGGNLTPVTWEVLGGDKNGTVTQDGLYTAPGVAGTYQIRVFVQDDPTKYAISTVKVGTTISVTVTATNPPAKLNYGQTLQLKADVTGADPNFVAWAVVSSGGGSVTSTGFYTAPTTPGYYTVRCQSLIDTTKIGTYNVIVSDTAVVDMKTSQGEVLIRMAPEAPNTTANFTKLAGQGFYDGCYFHRYGPDEGQPNFIQGGDPLTKTLPLSDPSIGTGGPGYTINFETTGLKHVPGAIAMARSQSKDSAGCQFYICNETITNFDGNYCVFGKVIGGLDVVAKLRKGDKMNQVTVIP